MADTETTPSTDSKTLSDGNPSESCSQAEIDLGEDLKSRDVLASFDLELDDEFHDVYRDGNFGERRGKLNLKLAQRWSIAHFLVAVILSCLALSCVILMKKQHRFWVNRNVIDAFSSVAILCGITGTATAFSSLYLIHRLSKLRRPLFVLLLVRLMAYLECIFVHGGIILVLAIVGASRQSQSLDSLRTFRVLCVFLVIIMIVDWISAMVWLFHWWRCCPWLECFKSLAIFEPGEPLAEGVPDPRSGLINECAIVCSGICRGTDYGALV